VRRGRGSGMSTAGAHGLDWRRTRPPGKFRGEAWRDGALRQADLPLVVPLAVGRYRVEVPRKGDMA